MLKKIKMGSPVFRVHKLGKGAPAPVAKHDKALEQIDGGGTQQSDHPAKSQPKIMRYVR
jgi:hypothetical protein